MEINKQLQSAGDNAQQMQASVINVYQGITEQRAREIYNEMSLETCKENTIEAEAKAIERIEKLESICIPRLEQEDKIFECFSDPSFQVLIKKAQLTAVCTERENDYAILSELLVHRIKNKTNVKKKASIAKAVEIIDQIDEDSLLALTVFLAINQFLPISGNITMGLQALDDLYSKLDLDNLPTDSSWIDNLSILGAINTVSFGSMKKYEKYFSEQLTGYVCIGIKKDSENYNKAIQLLKENSLDINWLVENELLSDYFRLDIPYKQQIDELKLNQTIIYNGQKINTTVMPSEQQKECLNKIFDLYEKNNSLYSQAKNNFELKLDTFPSIKKAKTWWNSLKGSIHLTSVGRVIAHTNAKSIDPTLPNLD